MSTMRRTCVMSCAPPSTRTGARSATTCTVPSWPTMPGIEQRVFDLLEEYLDELDLVASNLHLSAGNYEWAEHLSVDHG